MTDSVSQSVLGSLSSDAVALVTSGTLATPSEEWRYTSPTVWGESIGRSFDIDWTCQGRVMVSRFSQNSLSFSDQFGWTVTQLHRLPGALLTLAGATDALAVDGAGRVFFSVDSAKCPFLPIVVHVPEGQSLALSLSVTGAEPGHVCLSIHLDKGASCTVNETLENTAAISTSTCLVQQADSSAFTLVGVDCPTHVAARAIHVKQMGEHINTQLTVLNLGSGNSENYIHTDVAHLAPHSESHQRIKSILTEHAVSEFKGAVFVDQAAQKTDSSQSNQNMVLSDHARALSRPQLAIFADDVKCTHGATMSQLDDDQVVYLRSRGIHPSQAKAVLMAGFADEVIDQLTDVQISTSAKAMARNFFEAVR